MVWICAHYRLFSLQNPINCWWTQGRIKYGKVIVVYHCGINAWINKKKQQQEKKASKVRTGQEEIDAAVLVVVIGLNVRKLEFIQIVLNVEKNKFSYLLLATAAFDHRKNKVTLWSYSWDSLSKKYIWSCRLISALVRDTSAGWPLWDAEPETAWLQVTSVQISLRVRTHLCVYLSWVSAGRWVCVGSWTFWPALTTPATSRRSLWRAVFRSEPAALTPPCRRHRWSPPEGPNSYQFLCCIPRIQTQRTWIPQLCIKEFSVFGVWS